MTVSKRTLTMTFAEIIEDGDMVLCFLDAKRFIVLTVGEFTVATRKANPPPPPPKPIESPEQRRERLIKETQDRLSRGQPSEIVVVPTAAEQANPNPEVLDDVQRTIAEFGLKPRTDDPMRRFVKINEEAGRDGSMLNLDEAKRLSDLCVNTGVDQGVRNGAFARLCAVPLFQLYKLINAIPEDLRAHIALTVCENLGSGQHGEGKNFIPKGWADFITGQIDDWDEIIAASGVTRNHHAPPPVENFKNIHMQETRVSSLKAVPTTSGLESRWASMQKGGTEPLQGG